MSDTTTETAEKPAESKPLTVKTMKRRMEKIATAKSPRKAARRRRQLGSVILTQIAEGRIRNSRALVSAYVEGGGLAWKAPKEEETGEGAGTASETAS